MKTLVLALSLFSSTVFAWGPTGHRVVGHIAEKHLSVPAATKIYKWLNYNTLSRVANWPDEIKSEPETYSHTYNWHYTDWADESHDHDETSSSGRLLGAIREQVSVLKDPKASDEKKAFAVKFIVHLIGDLHQPLHVGNGLDQGGNKCKVIFQGKVSNLHAVWDEEMINFSRLSFTELAAYVSQGRSKEDVAAWAAGDVLDWALESKNIRAQIYPENVARPAEPQSVKQYCRADVTVQESEMPKIGYEYSYKFVPVMERRLFQAGLRLAMVLNEALK